MNTNMTNTTSTTNEFERIIAKIRQLSPGKWCRDHIELAGINADDPEDKTVAVVAGTSSPDWHHVDDAYGHDVSKFNKKKLGVLRHFAERYGASLVITNGMAYVRVAGDIDRLQAQLPNFLLAYVAVNTAYRVMAAYDNVTI
jgi:hypothetical protein